MFFPSGKPESEGEFKDKKRSGKWTYWNEDGTVDETQTGTYEADVKTAASSK
jgi:antitoxin component YwqK of YwqJK toxin-antitoxin module